ncbi:MAG: 16S rRNA (cytidine(1402)-2'-O)-methyltransferase [Bacteroidetes bacterium GWA2_30_7]|nr:MAG: 16S rRNA (cytidine(1402)-2'-O)-methyltransferase [Bacteroidetes bacterium GWA2_30_7]
MSKLYIIPTPIGNLEDITLRALRILKEVDLILAEDTRVTKKLLMHFGIEKSVQSYHSFNEHKVVNQLVNKIQSGAVTALVSDAGTPGISDPGFLITKHCLENNIQVECLPGATAFVPALIKSGFASDSFCFEGFLPQKKGRQTMLKELALEKRTIILYESPHKILKTLSQIIEFFGEDRKVSVSRELTKIYEETITGNSKEVLKYFSEKQIRGEFVVVIEGFKK